MAEPETPPEVDSWGWTRGSRICLAALTALGLFFLLVQYLRHPYRLDDPIVVINGKPAALEGRIDPNKADWPSLARLPDIGATRARAIVDYRQKHQTPSTMAFEQADDLLNVPGIGRKLLHGARPFLVFPADANAPAPAPFHMIGPKIIPDGGAPTP